MTHNLIPITRSVSRWWLLLGVGALAVAGLFALVLVVARTPGLAELPLFDRMFHKALVVHVDLSVLVWFLSIACLMWSLLAEGTRQVFPYLEEAALISFALGAAFLAVSALDPHGAPLMSNYIPVITSPLFFLGLALLTCGVGLMLIKLATTRSVSPFNPLVTYAAKAAALVTFIALLSFGHGYVRMPGVIEGQQYYDLLFWGGGHLLQFTHALMLIVCWLLLARALKSELATSKLLQVLINLTMVAAIGGFLLSKWAFPDVTSMEYRDLFTDLMIWGNGIAPIAAAALILPSLRQARKDALYSMLLASVILFLYGGILGGMIRGQNVVIPAHYHGAIVGITLAFMGVAYLLLPRFGYADVRQWKLAFWQPVIYGGGQAMHITGLAISGGYGVLRKTPGAINEVSTAVKAGMGLMGIGGFIAIVGGIIFVIVIVRAVWPRPAA